MPHVYNVRLCICTHEIHTQGVNIVPKLVASDIASFTISPPISDKRKDKRKLESLLFGLSEHELLHLVNLVERRLISTKPDSTSKQTQEKANCAESLSVRENEVLTLVASGYTRPEISAALNISPNTAASHIANIYRKLDVSSIAEATTYAIRLGITS